MNSQIETWRVQAYAANVYHLSQQKGSRLAGLARKESFVGKTEYFDRLALATAQVKQGRNSDTPDLNITHSRRQLTTVTYEWATLVDRKDKLQNIHSPESEYSMAAMHALGRSMDEVLIAAAFGTAYVGETGSSSQTLGTAQKVAAVSSGAISGANIQLLRKAKLKMDSAEVEGRRYIVHAADFLEDLLSQTETTSSDYNTVKALVRGELNEYMGFTFIHSELVNATDASTLDSDTFKYNTTTGLYDASGTAVSTSDSVALAVAEGGLILGENVNGRVSRVGERADKGYSNQIYSAMDLGAVRMEEAKVLQLVYR